MGWVDIENLHKMWKILFEWFDNFFYISYRSGHPDPPYNLKLINTTHNSIAISWTPGFNGGAPQRFQVRYTKIGDAAHRYADVNPPNASVYQVTGNTLNLFYIHCSIKQMIYLLVKSSVQHLLLVQSGVVTAPWVTIGHLQLNIANSKL